MPNPAFIVEGQMEQKILARICPGQPVRRIGCNGDDVTITRLCDFIETQIRTLGNRNYPIFVIFDREGRELTSEQISVEVKQELDSRGLADQDIRVFVADRETEDWYLADIEQICEHHDITRPAKTLRGKGGLETLLATAGGYHETTIGVETFFLVRMNIIAQVFPDFAKLVVAAQEVSCSHFMRDQLI